MVTLDVRDIGSGSTGRSTRRYASDDLSWAVGMLGDCGGRLRFRRGSVVDTATLPGVVVLDEDVPVGLLTVLAHRDEIELAAIATGPGDDETFADLVTAAIAGAGHDCRRLFVVCTNAELDMHRLLQQHGFRLCAVRPGSIAAARGHMPPGQIPVVIDGIPVTDEVEFEHVLI